MVPLSKTSQSQTYQIKIVGNNLMDIIIQVENALRDKTLLNNPHACADYRAQLSGTYSYLVGQLEEIKANKPLIWLEMRKDYKSDSATDKAYEATPDGIQEIKLRGAIKRAEKLISGLGSIIKVASDEARNQY